MYVEANTEMRCCEKAITSTHFCVFVRVWVSECVRVCMGVGARVHVALLIQNATCRHIFTYGISGSTTFFYIYLTHGRIFGKKLLNLCNVYFGFLYNFYLEHFSL
jgi:hypothetical protein